MATIIPWHPKALEVPPPPPAVDTATPTGPPNSWQRCYRCPNYQIYVHVYIYTQICVYIYTPIYIYTNLCVNIKYNIYIYLYIHTYTVLYYINTSINIGINTNHIIISWWSMMRECHVDAIPMDPTMILYFLGGGEMHVFETPYWAHAISGSPMIFF